MEFVVDNEWMVNDSIQSGTYVWIYEWCEEDFKDSVDIPSEDTRKVTTTTDYALGKMVLADTSGNERNMEMSLVLSHTDATL